MYLTGDEKRKIKYAGLELSPETEKKLMVVMEDNIQRKRLLTIYAMDQQCTRKKNL